MPPVSLSQHRAARDSWHTQEPFRLTYSIAQTDAHAFGYAALSSTAGCKALSKVCTPVTQLNPHLPAGNSILNVYYSAQGNLQCNDAANEGYLANAESVAPAPLVPPVHWQCIAHGTQ
jgi:hypothetical protein